MSNSKKWVCVGCILTDRLCQSELAGKEMARRKKISYSLIRAKEGFGATLIRIGSNGVPSQKHKGAAQIEIDSTTLDLFPATPSRISLRQLKNCYLALGGVQQVGHCCGIVVPKKSKLFLALVRCLTTSWVKVSLCIWFFPFLPLWAVCRLELVSYCNPKTSIFIRIF